jgi:arginyl-tRNA synthetase
VRIEPHLASLAADAIRDAHGIDAPPMLRPAKDAAHGDYQVDGLMALGKRLGRPPRDLAAPVAERLARADAIAHAEVAGPGFVNLKLDLGWLGARLGDALRDGERDGVPEAATRERIVVDFSAPNIAKEMHVGHLRSTILGDAICRLLRFLGHEVIGDNHIGDWGTQFGLLIVGMRRFGDAAALEQDALGELERVYKLANPESERDPAFADEARAELAKLQAGDPDNRANWQRFVAISREALDRVYARLDVHFDVWLGESAYEAMLPGVIELLLARGVAREDQGALCVFFEDEPGLGKSPFIVRKKDGAFLYATTDIATVLKRRDEFHADRALYVVDQRQALHFKQLFATVKKLGVAMALEHVAFGSILGADGKPLKTRDGKVVKLGALLDEAEERAAERIRAEGIATDGDDVAALARVVGVGAVKYADLSQNRLSDYRFEWDKLLSFKGNAGPYLQYAHARIRAIFRKGDVAPERELATTVPTLVDPAEAALGKQLARFPDVVHHAADTSQPHLLCEHLYALARDFSVFYEECPVLKAEGPTRASRLALSWLVARELARGLALLGIHAPERM